MNKFVKSNLDQRGFTLIELLVVIIIVGILATVALVYINPVEYINRSNDSKRMAELKTVNDALLREIADNKIDIKDSNVNKLDTSGRSSNGTGWVEFSAPSNFRLGGLPVLPVDPKSGTSGFGYKFCTNGTNNTWKLVTKLESSQNTNFMTNDGGGDTNLYEVGTDLTITCTL